MTVRRHQCIGKLGWQSKKEAKRVISRMRTKQGRDDLSAYRCGECGGWHIGHKLGTLRKRLARGKGKKG